MPILRLELDNSIKRGCTIRNGHVERERTMAWRREGGSCLDVKPQKGQVLEDQSHQSWALEQRKSQIPQIATVLRQLHFLTRTTMTINLSMQLRDRVSLPSKTATSRPCPFHGLPLEILEMLFGACNIKDLPNLLQTGKFLRVSHHVNYTDLRMFFMQLVIATI